MRLMLCVLMKWFGTIGCVIAASIILNLASDGTLVQIFSKVLFLEVSSQLADLLNC